MYISIDTFKSMQKYLFLVTLLTLKILSSNCRGCNKVFCASVVSKCILTQACKCELSTNKEKCTCCVNCAKCLGKYYQQCCTCLGMCDSSIQDIDPSDSQIGDFDPFIELFNAVTQDAEVPLLDGLVLTYPAEKPLDDLAKMHQSNKFKENLKNDALPPVSRIGVNCTVVFMSQCHSGPKCREKCKTIGSGSYRFFFNGCCECVGPTCLNYGINKSQCPLCSELEDTPYDHYMSDDGSLNNEIENDIIL